MAAALTRPRRPAREAAAPRRQGGVVLFIALIILVAMALAGIALVRSVDTGVIVAGNIAFKQGATLAGDQGLEAARAWLMANKANLNSDRIAAGASAYYANWQAGFDLTGTDPDTSKPDFDWKGVGLEVTANDGAGNRVRYVIHRLCANSGVSPAATSCVRVSAASGGGGAKGGEYGGRRGYEAGGETGGFNLASTLVYYRVTVRVDAPRNTVSYVQALLY
jgi:type IV pilus assembly protein PilX